MKIKGKEKIKYEIMNIKTVMIRNERKIEGR